jgi:DNA repair protein RecO (recombination protein O)
MEWRAEGLILSARPHGENSAILDLFTRDHGRQAGVLRGGAGRRMAAHVQPGNQALVTWRARLDDHLGTLTLDPAQARAAQVLSDRLALAGLAATCALLARALPERQPFAPLYEATQTLLDALGLEGWALLYLHWEVHLLAVLGFGLDLDRCAVTGATGGLCWVSPRTGRAVSAEGARGWEDRLLPLPEPLGGTASGGVSAGLRLTGHFLHQSLCADPGARPLPEARARLLALVSRLGTAE